MAIPLLGPTESISDTTLDNLGDCRRLPNPDGRQACRRRSPTGNQQWLAGARGYHFSRPDQSLRQRRDRERRPCAHHQGTRSKSYQQAHLSPVGHLPATGGQTVSCPGVAPVRKKILKTAALRAKIQGPIGWHTLRHSYRAWLDETGAPLGVQQKLMRHANISTTMNVYGGAFMEAKREANRFGGAAGAASRPYQIAKGRHVDGLCSGESNVIGPFQTTIENPNSS
jgi:Phage integrase family